MTTSRLRHSILQAVAVAVRTTLILGLSELAFGQTAVKPADYSQESSVVEDLSSEIIFANDGTGQRSISVRIRVQSAAGVEALGVLPFAYQKSSETVEIDYARVHKPDGTTVVTPVNDSQDVDSEITRQAPLYSDSRQKQLAVKGLGAGDVLEYSAHWHVTKPLAPGQFWGTYNFSEGQIILHEKLQVSVPMDRPVKWKSEGFKPVITEAAGLRTYTWTHAQLTHPSPEQEKKDQAKTSYQASIGKLPQAEIQISSFLSWEEVGKWYISLQADRVKTTAEVRAKALELTKDLIDDDAKTRAIYYYVSTQFRYIGVDFGIGRYQPHAAAEVLSNQYGDCKDKHTLLAALLGAVGITAYPALLDSKSDIDRDVPSPAQFDHVITVVAQANRLTWLDSTPEVASFGYLISTYRNKTALVMPDQKTASLTTIPARPLTPSLETFRIDAKLNEAKILEGEIERTVHGDDAELLLRFSFRRTPSQQWKDLAQRLSFLSGFAGEVSGVTSPALDKTDRPFDLKFHYVRKDYPADKEMLLPVPPFNLPAVPDDDARTENPIRLDGPSEFRYESHVELPKGERPRLPKKVDLVETFAEYHASYAYQKGVLTAERTLTLKVEDLPPSAFEAFGKFSKALQENGQLSIPLSSGTSFLTYQEEIWDLPQSDNAAAVKAYSDAQQSAESNDVPGMIASLKRAIELDPRYTRAWLWLGEIFKAHGQNDRALEAYRAALRINPEQVVSLKALGLELLAMRKLDEALSTGRDLMRLEPDSALGPYVVGGSLRGLKRCDEAAAAFEAAAILTPDLGAMQVDVGSSHLCAGDLERGLAAFRKAVELDPTPQTFNNIAFMLGEKSKALDTALEYATRAVRDETADSDKVSAATLANNDLQHTLNLVAYWDTLGWVYFRLGNMAKAESYIKPAWMLSQNAVIADHLGQIYEKEDKNQAALHSYRLALKGSSRIGLPDSIHERMDHLEPGSSKLSPKTEVELEEELSQMRLTHLHKLAARGTAEVFLVFSRDPKTLAGKVVEVKFINGSEELKAAAPDIKSVDFRVMFPADSAAKLVRRAILGCYEITGCSITLLNPGDVHSVN